MSLIPSPLNPIHFFGQDEPVYWKVNKFGADRGGYVRKWPLLITAQIYVQASALPVGAVIRCSDGVNLAGITFSLVTGNIYVANPQIPAGNTNFYIFISEGVEKDLYISPTPFSLVNSSYPTYYGAQIRVTSPSAISKVVIPINIAVAMVQGIEVAIMRVDPRNRAVVTLVESIVVNTAIGLTGDVTITANVSTAAASHAYNTNDYYTILTRPVNASDHYSMKYTDAGLGAQQTASLIAYTPGDVKMSYDDHLQMAMTVKGTDSVVSEIMDGAYTLQRAAYSRQVLVKISTSNVKEYLGIPPAHTIYNYVLADFWKKQFPHGGEDIETSPGEFTRLTSEAVRNRLFNTSYVPSYTHYQLILQMGCDNLKIDDVDYIQRPENQYTFENQKHYQLSMGSVLLTERKSITRNTI